MGIFDKRIAFKPYEYPEVMGYVDAINHSFWTKDEWKFTSDFHEYHTELSAVERTIIKKAMLAISQIEVSVKSFWGRLGDRFPKSEFQAVGATFAECHVEGTQVLTPRGWVDFRAIAVGDTVFQYHPDGTLTATTVQAKTDQTYTGPIHRFRQVGVDFAVTPEHRMLYFQRSAGGEQFTEARAADLVTTNTTCYWPRAAVLVGGVDELSAMDRLRIVIQADGNRRYWRNAAGERFLRGSEGGGSEYDVRIQKERKVARLDALLAELPEVKFTKAPVPSRPGMFCYTIKTDAEFDYKEMEWVDLTGKSGRWCEAFIQEVAEWDGTRLPTKVKCQIKYSSVNERVIDIVQAVGTAAGYRVYKAGHEDNRKESHRKCYVLSFHSGQEKVNFSPSLKREVTEYEGRVYCVTVESGAILTRYNGHTFIAGNSEVRHERAYSGLLEILGFNEEFDTLMTVPAIQDRVKYLTKYIKGAADNTNQSYTLSLALFSLFIENVSLFSQFAIVKAFNKERNLLKDIDNVIQATMKEETLHAQLGIFIINQIKKENPEWFNADFYRVIELASHKALAAEMKILDWIFEDGELSFLPKDVVVEFIKQRFNESIEAIGGAAPFAVDEEKLTELLWLTEEILLQVHVDFFHKKSPNYSKKNQAVTANDLF